MKYYIKNSHIQGKGVFSKKKIKKDDLIGKVIYYKFNIIPLRTKTLGLYLNHSFKNNCMLVYKNKSYYLVAIKDIVSDIELTINYNDTPWFIAGTWCIKNLK